MYEVKGKTSPEIVQIQQTAHFELNTPKPRINDSVAATTVLAHYSATQIEDLLAPAVNKGILRNLIKCESQNTNIARMDSNGKMSSGVLQFQQSTWDGFVGHVKPTVSSPMNPASAIAVADWMISNGFLGRWTCSRILGMLK